MLHACTSGEESSRRPEVIADNTELASLYAADQADRTTGDIDWEQVNSRDSTRRARVRELLEAGDVRTGTDHKNAAMVFQHGKDSVDYKLATSLMAQAIELDTSINKWLYAAATDRYRQSIDSPQIFGTQYLKFGDEPWNQGQYDTARVTDEERRQYGVETLEEQRAKLREMNSSHNEE